MGTPPPDLAGYVHASDPDRRGTTGMIVGAVVVIALIFGVAVKVTSGHGGSQQPDRSDVAGAGQTVDALAGVCASTAQPIAKAKPFGGPGGSHRVEVVAVPPTAKQVVQEPERVQFTDPVWHSPDSDEKVDLSEVEVVGCYVVANVRKVRDCEYEAMGASTAASTQPLYVTSGRVVAREAATGKELGRYEVGEPATPGCPMISTTGTLNFVNHPVAAIEAHMRRFNDGTQPGWSVDEQVAGLCSGQVTKRAPGGANPASAVAVMVGPRGGPYVPYTRASGIVLPPELHPVAPAKAGTVLCLGRQYAKSKPRAMAITVDTGDRTASLLLAGTTSADGTAVLPWGGPKGLQEALGAKRA